MEIMNIKKLAEKAIEDRRHLHQYPELSGQEYETSEFIRQRLEKLDIEILDYEPPGVVAFIKGTNGSKTIALRADIDALPIVEEGDKPYISNKQGVAHMCGHDGHTAILLAVAAWISLNREKSSRILSLYFNQQRKSPQVVLIY